MIPPRISISIQFDVSKSRAMNHHSQFTPSGRANGSHSLDAAATVLSGWAHARLVSLRNSAAPTKSRKSGWALVGLD